MNNQTQNYNDTTILTNESLTKYSPNTGTCFNKNIKHFIPGFAKQFQDSFCYANIIQCLIVGLMYYKAGHGLYWKILIIAAVSGCIASLLENATVAFICLPSQKDNNWVVVPFFIDEIFWTTQQFSVPILNLIKMKVLVGKRTAKIMKGIILFFLIVFIFFRGFIGYERMMRGYLVDHKINILHGFAFGTIAVVDMFCTVSILYLIRKQSKNNTSSISVVTQQVKSSSYTILICVDVVETLLSIFDIFANVGIPEEVLDASVAIPFQCLMSNFILILATDILLMKYESHRISQLASDNNQTVTSEIPTIKSNIPDSENEMKKIKKSQYYYNESLNYRNDKNLSFIG